MYIHTVHKYILFVTNANIMYVCPLNPSHIPFPSQ